MTFGSFMGLVLIGGLFMLIGYNIGYDRGRNGRKRFPWSKVPGTLLFALLLLAPVTASQAQDLYWTAPATYTDGTTIPAATLSALKYYVRTNEPNPTSVAPDNTGKYYIGETIGGVVKWPGDNNIAGRVAQGTTVTLTVSAGYRDGNGVWQESVPSTGLAYTRPFVTGGPPKDPTGLRLQ